MQKYTDYLLKTLKDHISRPHSIRGYAIVKHPKLLCPNLFWLAHPDGTEMVFWYVGHQRWFDYWKKDQVVEHVHIFKDIGGRSIREHWRRDLRQEEHADIRTTVEDRMKYFKYDYQPPNREHNPNTYTMPNGRRVHKQTYELYQRYCEYLELQQPEKHNLSKIADDMGVSRASLYNTVLKCK